MRWQPERLVFVGFDLLYLDGKDLRPRPLIERRAALEKLIGDASGAIQFSHHIGGSGHAFYEAIDRMGIEGMVSKRASAPYRSGRTESRLKVKCYEGPITRSPPCSASQAGQRCLHGDTRQGTPLCRRRFHHAQRDDA
jgi:ATP-dependent DNA ligase